MIWLKAKQLYYGMIGHGKQQHQEVAYEELQGIATSPHEHKEVDKKDDANNEHRPCISRGKLSKGTRVEHLERQRGEQQDACNQRKNTN
jgi:hypothetical protein